MIKPIEETKKILIDHISENSAPEGFTSKICKRNISEAENYYGLYVNIYNWFDFFSQIELTDYNLLSVFRDFEIISDDDIDRIYKISDSGDIRAVLSAIDTVYDRQTMMNGDLELADILDI